MPCYHPMAAYRPRAGGSILFADRGDCDPITITCKQCIGCKLERARDWATRCMHEASMHERNVFLTLTWDDAHLPADGQLEYLPFQLFMKRLWKFAQPWDQRFYMCGEYGGLYRRPHYHALVFGFDFDDKSFYKRSESGDKLYTSDALSRLWPYGFATAGGVTFESAGYCARYCCSKITGDLAYFHYASIGDSGDIVQLNPEFNRMSLKPGLGASWLEKFESDVFPRDYVIVRGSKFPVPAYYDKLFSRSDPFTYEDIKVQRILASREFLPDNTDARLLVKEHVQKAASSLLLRSL